MKNVKFIALCSLVAVAIGLSAWSLARSYLPKELDVEYAMYIGTNDKETYQLEKTKEEAKDIVHNTMMDHFADGFTMYEADGVWRDENNVITLEYSFVCILEQVEKKEVYLAADELLVALNQNTILIVQNAVHAADFYQGAK